MIKEKKDEEPIIKTFSGIFFDFSKMSELEIKEKKNYYYKLAMNVLYSIIVFFIIGVILIILASKIIIPFITWLVIGIIIDTISLSGIWWFKIYLDASKKCAKELLP